ncbi:hypothetical protein [Actinoallomurus acaciae]|uniref:hypothetical protein n=1 Tax=Actinoallomurus acaciae TaxID=502577 RepID=UPI00366BA53A
MIKHAENRPVKRSNVLVNGFFIGLIKAVKWFTSRVPALTWRVSAGRHAVRPVAYRDP